MIEGAYARAGLVSDVEVVENYPSHMSAFSRRKHRWVRGDWQIIFWLLPGYRTFSENGAQSLSIISRWKILDNLRRSLTEMAMFVMLAERMAVLSEACAVLDIGHVGPVGAHQRIRTLH